MTVQDYLDRHYSTAEQLADSCSVSVDVLESMIAQKLIPQPSYKVVGEILISSAFGELDAPGARTGSYYHPASQHWIARAQSISEGQAADTLKKLFFVNMAAELSHLNNSTFRLVDAFDENGRPLAKGLEARIASYWQSFLQGIFGLCVANPVSEREISHKEILQEKLTTLTENGKRCTDLPIRKDELLLLISQYEASSMPFSPVEYPISSRKRLVDDLRLKCEIVTY
jgi:Family of unknown function (DUF6058)